MTSRVTLALRAFSTAAASRAFPAGSAPPIFDATMISFTSFPTSWPFLRPATSRFACNHWRPISSIYQGRSQKAKVKSRKGKVKHCFDHEYKHEQEYET